MVSLNKALLGPYFLGGGGIGGVPLGSHETCKMYYESESTLQRFGGKKNLNPPVPGTNCRQFVDFRCFVVFFVSGVVSVCLFGWVGCGDSLCRLFMLLSNY